MALTFKTIVAAAELDDDLVNAILESAVRLAEAFDANLHVVDVVTPMKDFETPHAMDALDHDLEAHHKIGEQRLDQLTSLVANLMPAARADVIYGDPGRAVADYARENNADLLVIGSHQKGWWETMTKGAVSPELIRESPCAVFVVTKAVARMMA